MQMETRGKSLSILINLQNASEMIGKRNHLGTESYLSASDESGEEGEITFYSNKFTKTSCSKEKLIYKNPISKFFPLQIHSPRVYSPKI